MRRTWYLTALVPLAIGIAIAATSCSRLMDNIESMQRMVAPGERAFVLNAGDYAVFLERESVVNGTVYRTGEPTVRCSLATEDGKPIELGTPAGRLQYSLGSYAGRAVFEFELEAPVTVKLSCTSDSGQAVLAVGGGIGASIVVAVVAALFGFFSAVAVVVIIFVKRRRLARAQAKT